MGIDRHLIKNLDWPLLAIAIVIALLGIMTIFSATRPPDGGAHPPYYIKQVSWLLISFLSMAVIISFDYIWLGRVAGIIYAISLALLVLVLFAGRAGMGAQRWINIGPLSFQPSEIFKIAFLIAFAQQAAMLRGRFTGTGILRTAMIYLLLPFALLIKQPDLGTGMVLMMLFTALVLSKGVGRRLLMFILIICLISIPFMGSIFWEGLKDYQKNRLVAFLTPEIDPEGIGYHIIQSEVAIGSGGFWGKGFLKGTQGPFRFLPEKHTDFIFSVFAEEWGFAGCIVLLALYLILIFRAIDTAHNAKDEFGRYLALGIAYMLAIYTAVNLAMTMGLMPVVGIPLPFMSYGGTALLGNFLAIGLLMNIRARRFYLFY